jgi:hypothetical protein
MSLERQQADSYLHELAKFNYAEDGENNRLTEQREEPKQELRLA